MLAYVKFVFKGIEDKLHDLLYGQLIGKSRGTKGIASSKIFIRIVLSSKLERTPQPPPVSLWQGV